MSIDTTTAELFALAQQSLGLASLSAGRINYSIKPTLKETGFNYTPTTFTPQSPPQFSDLFSDVDNAPANIAGLNGNVSDWLNQYFPLISSGFQNVPEEYLIQVISGTQPFGYAGTVFDQVWQQARDRAGRTVRSESATLLSTFSARGFSLPPGALVDQLAQSERRGNDAVLDSNRDQALKDADIKNQILQQAVSIAADLKVGIMNTAKEVFKAYTSLYELDSHAAEVKAQAYQSFYSALSSYYNVEVSLQGLLLRAAETKASTDGAIDERRIGNYAADSTGRSQAEAASAFANVATGAATAAGTLDAHITSGLAPT